MKRKRALTRKAFSVVFMAWDPPCPVSIRNTNSQGAAERMYRLARNEEEQETRRANAVGGEWSLTLYKHTSQSEAFELVTDDDLVYGIEFTGSKVVKRYTYMEAYALLGR